MPDPHAGSTGERMAVTVEDLLQLALPQGTEVVGGRAGLKRQVVWARSLRPRPPAFESLEGGEMALLSSVQLSMLQESMTLAYVVQRLAEVGVAAIAVLGEVDGEAIQAADALAIPLIKLPSGCSLVEVERSAIATVVDRQAELQARASEIHRQLAQITFEERGLQAVVDRLAEITHRSVAIEDEQFRVQFAAAAPGLPHPDEVKLRAGKEAIEAWIATVVLSGAQPPVAKFPIAGTELARFVAPIPARDGVAGYLSAIGDPSSLTELDRLAVGRGAAVCAVEVAKEAAIGEAEARVRGDLLDQLLSDGMDTDQAVLGKARRLGYDPSLPSLVMAFRLEARERGATAFRGVERARRQLESAVRVELTRREARSLVASRGASIVAVIPLQLAPNDQAALDLAEGIRGRAEVALDGWRVAAGVGRPAQSHGGLVTTYREAEGALSIGIRVNGPSSTTYFGSLGILRLLAQVGSGAELESFRHEMLGKLEEHDKKASGELLKTMEALFQCHGNLSRTAEQLSLHRNSLLYRLQRVEEISGLALDDAEVRLSLQVALKVRQLLEAERAGRA
jgi:PucR family transcriptional regulator, purine catabolism regulatory protein